MHLFVVVVIEVLDMDEAGAYTLRSRVRLKSASARCMQPSQKTLLALSRSAKIRMKASIPIPNLSEGILPPEAQPVTTEEALHHLAKRVRYRTLILCVHLHFNANMYMCMSALHTYMYTCTCTCI